MKKRKQKNPKRGRNNDKTIIWFGSILERGKQNAILTSQLMDVLGITSEYVFRREIQRARREGEQVILSCSRGYYLPLNDGEIAEYIDSMNNRIASIESSIASAKRELEEMQADNVTN